jgi:hypothetical protein
MFLVNKGSTLVYGILCLWSKLILAHSQNKVPNSLNTWELYNVDVNNLLLGYHCYGSKHVVGFIRVTALEMLCACIVIVGTDCCVCVGFVIVIVCLV